MNPKPADALSDAPPAAPPAAPREAHPAALPPDDPLRVALHDEVHARPTARVRLPALMQFVAVLNDGVDRTAELAHLRRLPGQAGLADDALDSNFLRLRLGAPGTEGAADGARSDAGSAGSIKWERHAEFSRYTVVQSLPAHATEALPGPDTGVVPPLGPTAVDAAWLGAVPGRTIAAIELVMLVSPIDDEARLLQVAAHWFGARTVVGSYLGGGHSCALTDFALRHDGFERMLVLAPPTTTETRSGRIAARLLELETYRMMALRGLPAAKTLQPLLARSEAALAGITVDMEHRQGSDEHLLDTLVGLAAGVERATAEHGFRFAATRAYHGLVRSRIAELREKPIPGTQTIGEFMQRRLTPAIATVDATAERLTTLSQRIERAGALLRTRVDIARELQNQELLSRLARGQSLQLRLQSTVEGLSIAAISYYVVSLLLYGAKAAKLAGAPIQPELAVGVLIPAVVWSVWRVTRRIHERLHRDP